MMPSTHDWINNPLGVVEGMFGKRHTGTSPPPQITATELAASTIRLGSMLIAN